MPGGVTVRSPDVDAIIAALPDWRSETLERIRSVIHASEPEIVEASKWRRPGRPLGCATFERYGIVCIVVPLKERVRIVFPDGSRLPDPKKLFNAQLDGKSRAIDIREAGKFDAPAIRALVRASVKLKSHSKVHSGNLAASARK